MERNLIVSAMVVGIILPAVGCTESAPPTTTEATLAQQDATLSPPKSTARSFLQAVIDGDTQQATGLLTPQAIQQLQQSGKAFAPPGLETASFQIGAVRKLSDAQAFVQCYLTDSSAQQTNTRRNVLHRQTGSRSVAHFWNCLQDHTESAAIHS